MQATPPPASPVRVGHAPYRHLAAAYGTTVTARLAADCCSAILHELPGAVRALLPDRQVLAEAGRPGAEETKSPTV